MYSRKLSLPCIVVLSAFWVGTAGSADRKDSKPFAPVAQTGQTVSHDVNTPPADDGALQMGVELPTPRFIDKGNGTIKDNLTGLIWLKNANCPGQLREWQQALDDIASLNQTGRMNGNDCGDTSGEKRTHQTDWRLPNVRELQSLVHFAVRAGPLANPMISNARGDGQCTPTDCAFSNFEASSYWSSTTLAVAPEITWLVSFFRGGNGVAGKTSIFGHFVLAVRGGWKADNKVRKKAFAPVPETGQVLCYDGRGAIVSCLGTGQDGALLAGVELPTPRFIDKGNGTIKDDLTGLIWLKNANCPGEVREWQQALDDIASLNQTGTMNGNDCGDTSGKSGAHHADWRLPNIRELQSLIDFAFFAPAISNANGDGQCTPTDCAFSDFQDSYWSSTTIVFQSEIAWRVLFFSGFTNDFFKSFAFGHVLAVRGDGRRTNKETKEGKP